MGRDLFCKLCNTFIVGRGTPEWLLLPLWTIYLLTCGISFDRIKNCCINFGAAVFSCTHSPNSSRAAVSRNCSQSTAPSSSISRNHTMSRAIIVSISSRTPCRRAFSVRPRPEKGAALRRLACFRCGLLCSGKIAVIHGSAPPIRLAARYRLQRGSPVRVPRAPSEPC